MLQLLNELGIIAGQGTSRFLPSALTLTASPCWLCLMAATSACGQPLPRRVASACKSPSATTHLTAQQLDLVSQ